MVVGTRVVREAGHLVNGDEDLRGLIALLKLASLINRPMLDKVAGPNAMSLNELRVLMSLAGEGAAAAHDLAELMGMHPMAVSRAVSNLRDENRVHEVRDPDNRRRKVLSLTERGWEAYRATLPKAEEVAKCLFGALNATERRSARNLLGRLVDQLEDWPRS